MRILLHLAAAGDKSLRLPHAANDQRGVARNIAGSGVDLKKSDAQKESLVGVAWS